MTGAKVDLNFGKANNVTYQIGFKENICIGILG